MANPDFSTIGGELAYWLSHIGKFFKGGWSGSGENGVDIKMPVGTPVYALASGPVVGQGYYGGGGVVSVEQNKGQVWYYQHLDLIEPGIESGSTKQVQAGQLLGWSGGQSTGGHHPSSLKFSDDGTGHGWPHIEVGVNAPWGGIWGPMADKGPNVDPLPILKSIAQSGGSAHTGTPVEPTAFTLGPTDILGGLGAWLKSTFGVLFTWLTDPLRILKLLGGATLIFIASQIAIAGIGRQLAGPALEAAAAVAAPEAAAAGAAPSATVRAISATGRIAKSRQQQRQQQQALPPPQAQPTSGPPALISGPPTAEGLPTFVALPAWNPTGGMKIGGKQRAPKAAPGEEIVYADKAGKQPIGTMVNGQFKPYESTAKFTTVPAPMPVPAQNAPDAEADKLAKQRARLQRSSAGTADALEQLNSGRNPMSWAPPVGTQVGRFTVDEIMDFGAAPGVVLRDPATGEKQLIKGPGGLAAARKNRDVDPLPPMDKQCEHCYVIYEGPHKGQNPGHEVTEIDGTYVSHGFAPGHPTSRGDG